MYAERRFRSARRTDTLLRETSAGSRETGLKDSYKPTFILLSMCESQAYFINEKNADVVE